MRSEVSSAELQSQRWLTRREVATYLRASQGTVDKLLREGRLPVARLGKRILVDRLEVDRLLVTSGGL
jgi:excisionase family DNA binding protein